MLRVGLVGCGFMGRQHALAYRVVARRLESEHPAAMPKLVAVCDADPGRADAVAAEVGAVPYTDLGAMLTNEKLDLVDVVTPDFAHREPALTALAAGCHAFVEKPIAQTTADASAMIEAARRANRALAVNFNRRFARPYALARQVQQDGRLGRLSYAMLRVALKAGRAAITPYELVYDSLIHLLDLARWYGGEVAEVSCTLDGLAESGYGRAYHDAAISLRFADGGVGTVVGSWRGSRLHGIEYAELQGAGGRATVDNVVSRFSFAPNDDGLASVWEPRPFGDETRLLQFYPTTVEEHLAALLPALAEGRPVPVSGEDGLAALRLVRAAVQSFETGRPAAPAEIV
ncbi:MAG: Gfo/Idh/MocA family oxidoreductase [Chloroflexi bacterium]|nr:Gfo/Idh/MocA family oxidoreductase [Chloroflexota bacterium]